MTNEELEERLRLGAADAIGYLADMAAGRVAILNSDEADMRLSAAVTLLGFVGIGEPRREEPELVVELSPE